MKQRASLRPKANCETYDVDQDPPHIVKLVNEILELDTMEVAMLCYRLKVCFLFVCWVSGSLVCWLVCMFVFVCLYVCLLACLLLTVGGDTVVSYYSSLVVALFIATR